MPEFAELLRRFHAVAVGEMPLAAARDLVRDDGVDPAERMEVYAYGYKTRLRDVLALDYPKLAAVLDEDDFARLAASYTAAHPPAHPPLGTAGIHLPEFLRAAAGDDDARCRLADLAALERARSDAFEGADARPLARADLARLCADEFASLELRLLPASALVEMSSNADELWLAIEDGAPPPAVIAAPRTVLVWRPQGSVLHRTLDPDEAVAIAACAAGSTFGAVCEALVADLAPAERALALMLRWLDAGVMRER